MTACINFHKQKTSFCHLLLISTVCFLYKGIHGFDFIQLVNSYRFFFCPFISMDMKWSCSNAKICIAILWLLQDLLFE